MLSGTFRAESNEETVSEMAANGEDDRVEDASEVDTDDDVVMLGVEDENDTRGVWPVNACNGNEGDDADVAADDVDGGGGVVGDVDKVAGGVGQASKLLGLGRLINFKRRWRAEEVSDGDEDADEEDEDAENDVEEADETGAEGSMVNIELTVVDVKWWAAAVGAANGRHFLDVMCEEYDPECEKRLPEQTTKKRIFPKDKIRSSENGYEKKTKN